MEVRQTMAPASRESTTKNGKKELCPGHMWEAYVNAFLGKRQAVFAGVKANILHFHLLHRSGSLHNNLMINELEYNGKLWNTKDVKSQAA